MEKTHAAGIKIADRDNSFLDASMIQDKMRFPYVTGRER
jgi:hypothetical protein